MLPCSYLLNRAELSGVLSSPLMGQPTPDVGPPTAAYFSPDLPVDLPGTGGLRPVDGSIGELLDLSTIAFLFAVDAATERTVFPADRDVSGADRPMWETTVRPVVGEP